MKKKKNTTPLPEKMEAPKHLDKNWAPLQIMSLNIRNNNKHHIFLVWPMFTNVVD